MTRCRGLMILVVIFGIPLYALSVYSEEDFLKKGSEGRIAFLNGRVGQPERDILKERGKVYPLRLIFSNKKGEYLSNVMLELFDGKGKKIFTTASNGPWLFIELPSGIYYLETNFKGEKRTIPKFRIEKNIQKVLSIQWQEQMY
jgi:hypothetical protein